MALYSVSRASWCLLWGATVWLLANSAIAQDHPTSINDHPQSINDQPPSINDQPTSVNALFPAETVAGAQFSLEGQAKCHVLLFLGVECPVARQYGAKIQALADQFSGQPVQFVGINSNSHDSTAEVLQYQHDFQLKIPLLKDSSQRLAAHFGVTRTAEAVVIDREGQVLYQGRIDDQFSPGVSRGTTTSHDLHAAVQAILSGTPVAQPKTAPVGCLITFRKSLAENPQTTFTRDVAPLLWQHCYECHRPGEIGPFDVSDYDELLGWGEMLIEVIEQQRMPPWHADPHVGEFKNARKLPAHMTETVRRWIDEGMPYGAPQDLPPKPTFADGWRMPASPDVVIEMGSTPYRIPATGTVDYQYFVVDPGFTEDRWVTSSQIIPGAPEVVHHAIVFVRPPDDGEFRGIGWLNAYVPGQQPVIYPIGYARRIPAGSKLVFQMHYTPNGKEAFDVSRIGLKFTHADDVTHQVFTTVALDQDFEIPPQAAEHTVQAEMWKVDDAATLLAIAPHMHLRGKAFEVVGIKKSGESEALLRVPRYDFNWQHTYELAQPLPLQAYDRITIAATFDNSPANPFNPNPSEYVMWGDQTWEEMALGYFDVAIPRAAVSTVQRPRTMALRSASGKSQAEARTVFTPEKSQAYVTNMLKRYDRDNDNSITRVEAFGIFRDYGFSEVDVDHNDTITRDELERAARGRSGS